jgi:AraC-like DNA-binding protein
MPALLADLLATLARHLPGLTPAQVEALSEPVRLLAEACAAGACEPDMARDPPMAALLVERARQVVQENLPDPDFGPTQLCRLLAVSRSKLYRIFAESGGVAAFVQRERLCRARALLADQPESLSINLVAAQVGFTDHSTFSRAFRREFGLSPSAAREMALVRRVSEPRGVRPAGAPPVQ